MFHINLNLFLEDVHEVVTQKDDFPSIVQPRFRLGQCSSHRPSQPPGGLCWEDGEHRNDIGKSLLGLGMYGFSPNKSNNTGENTMRV